MNYEVKRLKLFEPLNFSIKENSIQDFSNENEEELVCFINKVPANSVNPNKKDFSDKNKIDSLLEDLAETIFLEALWQEVTFADNTIYARKLKEGNCSVFQLFVKVNQNF